MPKLSEGFPYTGDRYQTYVADVNEGFTAEGFPYTGNRYQTYEDPDDLWTPFFQNGGPMVNEGFSYGQNHPQKQKYQEVRRGKYSSLWMNEGFSNNSSYETPMKVPKSIRYNPDRRTPHYRGNGIQEITLAGTLYKNHPCYSTFRNYIELPIKDGYSHYKGNRQIVVGGVLDNPSDPRFNCLRTTRVPLSSGSLSYTRYKTQPRFDLDSEIMRSINGKKEGFSVKYPSRGRNCAYKFHPPGGRYCMYSTGGRYVCLDN